jgi:predicted nucleic acid-binding protein
MPDEPTNLFWDSCVFGAFLYDENAAYDVASISQYIEEAKNGKHRIYTSSIIFAEIADSKIKKAGIGSIADLMNDLIGATVPIDPSVNILTLAGRLKDIPYRKGDSKKRHLGTGDAIMLATCLYLDEAMGVKPDLFHTFDNGKGPKKEVPLLDYHLWCEGLSGEKAALASRVCALNRQKPIHPSPPLPLRPSSAS